MLQTFCRFRVGTIRDSTACLNQPAVILINETSLAHERHTYLVKLFELLPPI